MLAHNDVYALRTLAYAISEMQQQAYQDVCTFRGVEADCVENG